MSKHVTLSRKRELVWVSPEKIVPNDNNPRESAACTPDELVSIRRSITTLGVLEPVIVTPYKGDTYKLIEGERRWTSAKIEGVKEVPAIVVGRMNAYEEQVVMFNVHMQRRGWKASEEMNAIERLMETKPDKSDEELAVELGMTVSQLRDRRQVLRMGPEVRAYIAKGVLDYYAALRTDQVSKQFARERPEWTKKQGGEAGVRAKLLQKAKNRRGVVRELETVRRDIKDVEQVPDTVLTTWIDQPEKSLGEARSAVRSLPERRAVEDVVKDVRKLSSSLRRFEVDFYEAPNLSDLRRALGNLIDVAQTLEEQIVAVSVKRAATE
jgi:ParB family transcriptional regulator, chromosome partitioning protein